MYILQGKVKFLEENFYWIIFRRNIVCAEIRQSLCVGRTSFLSGNGYVFLCISVAVICFLSWSSPTFCLIYSCFDENFLPGESLPQMFWLPESYSQLLHVRGNGHRKLKHVLYSRSRPQLQKWDTFAFHMFLAKPLHFMYFYVTLTLFSFTIFDSS